MLAGEGLVRQALPHPEPPGLGAGGFGVPRRMISVMADLTAGPAPAAGTGDPPGEARDWGRALDAAGIIAGIFLALIVADIWTDGKLISRRLLGRGKDTPGDNPAAE